MALPDIIATELFDVNYQASDVSVGFVLEALEELSLCVATVHNSKNYILIEFYNERVEGELKIHRTRKQFELCAKGKPPNVSILFPFTGDWDTVYSVLSGERDVDTDA